VLATVVGCEPPTSARPGDKAVITADGRLRGWIGGSCSEPVVRREALRALAEGTPRLVRILAARSAPSPRSPSPTSPSPPEGEGRGGGRTTPDDSQYDAGGRTTPDDGQDDVLTFSTTCPSGGSLEVFVEPRLPRPVLLVFGASPAARALVALGAQVGFRTCAVHPGARREDFDADLVLPSLELAPASPGADTWAVVATMGHYDEDALEAALAYPDVDVALVASQRRAAAVLTALRERGLDEPTLRRVRAPAGGTRAGGQAEIALFAMAEVVAARLRRSRPRADLSAFATDPVCGMAVEVATAAWRAVHRGDTFSFCGQGCRDRFTREPERYLRKETAAG
jgi:xanthine dehydrogenase accessory factor